MNLALKAFGKSVAVIIWFYACSLIIGNGIVLFLGEEALYNQFMLLHSNLISVCIYLTIFIGIFAIDKTRNQFLKSFTTLHLKQIFGYILLGVGTYFIGICITTALIDYFPDYHQIENSFGPYEPVARFVAMVILAPLVEEYLFRYKIQGYLKEGFGSGIAIVGQAILFGLLHPYRLQKIYATVIGIIFGLLRERKQTIQCSLWMHITVNFIGWFIGSRL